MPSLWAWLWTSHSSSNPSKRSLWPLLLILIDMLFCNISDKAPRNPSELRFKFLSHSFSSSIAWRTGYQATCPFSLLMNSSKPTMIECQTPGLNGWQQWAAQFPMKHFPPYEFTLYNKRPWRDDWKMRIMHDKADLPCGEGETMMRLMNKNNVLAIGAAVAIVAMIDVILPKDNKDSDKLRLPRPGVKTPLVEPPASALRTTLRAPCTLVPDTHGASAMKMRATVPTTTIEAMLKEQAADNAAADNSHNKEAKCKAISWRLSTVRWSRRTFLNFPTEVSDPAPMVLDEEEQLIVDEPAPRAAAAESFPAFSYMASPPSVDSTGRPTPVHRTRTSQWGASYVPLAQATRLPLHSQWGHHKPPVKQMVPRKETPKPSAASVKKAPPVAAPQPPPKDETPAPLETGNGEYLLPVFHIAPFGTAVAMQETHHLDLFSFTDSFLEQSLDPYGISMGSMMFPSTALLQPIDEPIPSYQTITTCSCASSGSAPTCASANEELKWPEASWAKGPICTGKYVKVTMSLSSSTSYTKPVRITTLMSSTPPQPCKRSKNTILRLTMNKPTYGITSGRMISLTPRRTSWTLLEPEDRNMSVNCFTSTTKNIPCCPPGNATANSILRCGPKCARTSSRKVSFHSKTQGSIGTKSMPSSITSVKKQGTHSDSKPSAKNLRKSSTSTTCSKSTSQTAGPELRLPNQTDQGPIPTMELPAEQQTARSSMMQRSPLTPNCRQLPCLTPLMESILQGLCASILTETFPEVC